MRSAPPTNNPTHQRSFGRDHLSIVSLPPVARFRPSYERSTPAPAPCRAPPWQAPRRPLNPCEIGVTPDARAEKPAHDGEPQHHLIEYRRLERRREMPLVDVQNLRRGDGAHDDRQERHQEPESVWLS